MANDVPQTDGSIHHWVTSSYKVTDTIDGKEVVARESFDVFGLKTIKLKRS